jgi:hypothetical protein
VIEPSPEEYPQNASLESIPGRGAAGNPKNRFIRLDVLRDAEAIDPEDDPAPRTAFFRDSTRKIIATNVSPDVGFEASINPYRGCEHGCVYCLPHSKHAQRTAMQAGLTDHVWEIEDLLKLID